MKKISTTFIIVLLYLSNNLFSQETLFYNTEPGLVGYGNTNTNLKVADGNTTIATSYTQTACGLNYTQGSVFLAMRNPTAWPGASPQPAPIVISSIPPSGCATILKAFLYLSVNGNGIPITATVTNPQNATASFSMAVIGQGQNTCWNYPATYAYRADVTSIVTGNGTYSVSGIPVAPTSTLQPDDAHGATLLIIYKDNSQTYSGSIVIADGCATAQAGAKLCNISGFNVCGPTISTKNFMLIADLQKQADSPIYLNNATTNYTLTSAAQSYYNFISDPGTPAAVNQNTANYGAFTGGDCYAIILAGMYYRTSCLTCTLAPNIPSVSVVTSSNPICSGNQSATLTASGSNSYTWNTNATGSSIVVSPTVNTNYTVWSTNANGCGSASLTQSVSICNGVAEQSFSRNVLIYPNPSNGIFKLEMNSKIDNGEVNIYNSIGQLILSEKIKENQEIDLSKFSKGYYFCVIRSQGKQIHSEKIIIQ
ncbi:MAG: T9SS type A sorting domain-containing protein [Sphingobacteriaceae bacterium]|jgi:hypothetical protein